VKLPTLLLVVALSAAATSGIPQQAPKPLTKDQVMTVVTAGMDNADLAKQIEARGIDFNLTDDYLQALRKAGAQEVVITALRKVRPSPLSHDQLLVLVASGVSSERAAALVKQRGIDFLPDEKYLESLRTAGANDELIAVVREATPSEVQKHLARAAECEQNHAWADAEQEYRAALLLAPGNAGLLQKAEAAAKRQKPPQYKLAKTLGAGQHSDAFPMLFSSDGRWLANADDTGVELVEVATGRKVTLPAEFKPEKPIALAPDGRWLAVVTWAPVLQVQLWDIAAGRIARNLGEPSSAVFSLAASPDGRLLAVGAGAGEDTLTLWEVASGKKLYTTNVAQAGEPGKKSDATICFLAFSPDGRTIASASDNQTVQLWDTATGQELHKFPGDSTKFDPYVEVAFSPNGRWLGSATGALRIWDVVSGREVRPVESGKAPVVYHLAFSPDGDWLLTCDAMVNTWWEVATWHKASQFYDRDTVHQGTSGSAQLRFSSDGRWLAIGPPHFPVTVWERQ
jgi:hypothetical protein